MGSEAGRSRLMIFGGPRRGRTRAPGRAARSSTSSARPSSRPRRGGVSTAAQSGVPFCARDPGPTKAGPTKAIDASPRSPRPLEERRGYSNANRTATMSNVRLLRVMPVTAVCRHRPHAWLRSAITPNARPKIAAPAPPIAPNGIAMTAKPQTARRIERIELSRTLRRSRALTENDVPVEAANGNVREPVRTPASPGRRLYGAPLAHHSRWNQDQVRGLAARMPPFADAARVRLPSPRCWWQDRSA
jgi:hypothetical protein